MGFLIGACVGAAAVGTLWWYVDSRLGGVAAAEATVKSDITSAEAKAAAAVKAEVTKVL